MGLVVMASALFMLITFFSLFWTDIHPLLSTVIFSLSLTSGPVFFISTIPLTLPKSSIGTGMGLYKIASNIGATVMDVAVGIIQDKQKDNYHGVMAAMSCVSAVCLFLSVVYKLVDESIYAGAIHAGQTIAELSKQKEDQTLQQYEPAPNIISKVSMALVVTGLVFSWVAYFAFASSRAGGG
jgi:nitrate/nitrite transporter NarK